MADALNRDLSIFLSLPAEGVTSLSDKIAAKEAMSEEFESQRMQLAIDYYHAHTQCLEVEGEIDRMFT
ncbi:hypothetical protein N7457_002354 [Penicillium paradoxum]|uniref:uncharacterized protein n=1 Tax=Penicillium paradoxum TaxID=176176 RepID=UPI002548693C|nr:uncharacterized protein N7457_002354 [Penicillium paradoxum]KAJ5787364.1 hypothetical protein N7457_002354 [Penicillium paradoxum]